MVKEEYKELVERLNKKLADEFGYFTVDVPNFRISWSEDQFEWREGQVAKLDIHGNRIGWETGTQFLPKYRQWLPNMWVLEKCCDTINELKNKELTTKWSYEPAFPFRSKTGEPLPPNWDICWVTIYGINTFMGKPAKIYKDPEMEEGAYTMKIDAIVKELFGNETDTGDALSHKEGISVPSNYGVKL